MSFIAYGFNLHTKDHDLIRQMVQIVTDKPVDIYDLQNYDPVNTSEDVVFFFGEHWRIKEAKQKDCKIKIEFPDTDRLAPDYGDEDERELAFVKLKKLKDALNSGDISEQSCAEKRQVNVITEESLPDLTSQEVLQYLKAALDNKEVQAWEGPSKNGLKVRLTLETEEGTADINITFAELYFIKAAMETLQIKELELVPKSNFFRKDSS